jgi:CRISPR-associated endoribonuclease Cas6
VNHLKLAKYRFTLKITADTVLPVFIGNTIRGALGYALDSQENPAYAHVFKTDHAASTLNPYVISIPFPSKGRYKKGDTLTFFITLFGNATDYASHILMGAQEMCKGKLANCTCGDVDLIYERVWSDSGAESIPPCDVLTVHFASPTEIRNKKELVNNPDFSIFIDSLFGRINGIINNYTDGQFVLPYSLIALKPLVHAEYDLQTIQIKTSGQPIDCFVGSVKYYGDITRYLPYIDLGSQIYVGKKTTRAFGEYKFEI